MPIQRCQDEWCAYGELEALLHQGFSLAALGKALRRLEAERVVCERVVFVKEPARLRSHGDRGPRA